MQPEKRRPQVSQTRVRARSPMPQVYLRRLTRELQGNAETARAEVP
jgi:hypothetical protein